MLSGHAPPSRSQLPTPCSSSCSYLHWLAEQPAAMSEEVLFDRGSNLRRCPARGQESAPQHDIDRGAVRPNYLDVCGEDRVTKFGPNPQPPTPNPQPPTPNPQPPTPNLQPSTPNPQPLAPNPDPPIPNLQPPTPNPQPPTPKPQPPTPNPQLPTPNLQPPIYPPITTTTTTLTTITTTTTTTTTATPYPTTPYPTVPLHIGRIAAQAAAAVRRTPKAPAGRHSRPPPTGRKPRGWGGRGGGCPPANRGREGGVRRV